MNRFAAYVFFILLQSVFAPFATSLHAASDSSRDAAASIQPILHNAENALTTVNLEVHFTEIDRLQVNKVRFASDQGPLIMTSSNIRASNAIRLTILDPTTGEEIIQSEQSDLSVREFTLPYT
ncbi:hypothetical protein [Paenibacillus soyae]|nr:hypothetical protein [Paenibacillus soyae]